MITEVELSRSAQKELKQLPLHVVEKLRSWILAVGRYGVEAVRKIPGYHDEPLQGKKNKQRSIRLSKAYRAIYVVKKEKIEFIFIEEVNKHEY